MENKQQLKTIAIVVIAAIAIVLAVYSGFRSFRQDQGEIIGRPDIVPGGKAGEMQRQQAGQEQAPGTVPNQAPVAPGGR